MKYVYLIRKKNESKYKIGISKNPITRIKQLQTGSDSELVLINVYKTENSIKVEKTLHNIYSHNNLNLEWFDLSLEDELKFVETCKKIDKNLKFLKNSNNFFI